MIMSKGIMRHTVYDEHTYNNNNDTKLPGNKILL